MKILHSMNKPDIGGIQNFVVELAIHQKNKGHDVSILLNSPNGEYRFRLKENNINIIQSYVNSGYDIRPKKIFNLKKIYKDFDIIHFHTFSLIHFLALNKKKIIYTMHGLSKGVRQENFIKSFFRESLKYFFLNRVNFFVANSSYTMNCSIRDYGLKRNRKKVVLNGTKIKQIISSEYDIEKEFVIGLVSRFTKRKKIERLIKAFKIFLNKGGLGKLVLVGDGEQYLDIMNYIKKHNLEKNVLMVGFTTETEKFYKDFSICVFPSKDEPFGLVCIEAYSFGLPVIVYNDSGGLMEIVEKIEPYNIVENENQLANRMMFYLKNKVDILNQEKKRKDFVKNNFSIERMEEDYLKIYKEVLSN